MMAINFNGCETLHDVHFRHADKLAGLVLKQFFGTYPKDMVELSTPIYSVQRIDTGLIAFHTEDGVGNRGTLSFPPLTEVVTSINEVGDVFWSPDDYKKSIFSISDLPEFPYNSPDELFTALQLPSEILEDVNHS